MQPWQGWTSTAPTWNEWRARQRHTLDRARQQQADGPAQERYPFSVRELARLSFVRWLYQRDGLSLAQNDR